MRDLGSARGMRVRKTERQETILSELRLRPATRLGELAEMFEVSKETIRRDISEMSERGLLDRTYGGALPVSLSYEPDLLERSLINPEGRRRMAARVAELVAGAHVVMIDPGATMAHVCERLALSVPRQNGAARLTVITNSLKNAMTLAENPAIRIIACPGDYDEHEMATFGPLTLEFVARFRADVFISSAGGIGPDGIVDANSAGAAVKRAMMRQAGRTIYAIESRKFDLAQLEMVCEIKDIDDLVSDAPVQGELSAALLRHGVAVHLGA